jgi:hypothetical protein
MVRIDEFERSVLPEGPRVNLSGDIESSISSQKPKTNNLNIAAKTPKSKSFQIFNLKIKSSKKMIFIFISAGIM